MRERERERAIEGDREIKEENTGRSKEKGDDIKE